VYFQDKIDQVYKQIQLLILPFRNPSSTPNNPNSMFISPHANILDQRADDARCKLRLCYTADGQQPSVDPC
jgi:hypothetical protein